MNQKKQIRNTKSNVPTNMPNKTTKVPRNLNPKKQKNQNRIVHLDVAPQSRSKKSSTGAAYNDGFDVSSKPERRLVRVEEFDELVGTVTGQTAFTILPFACNPGQSAVFSRLSKFAQLYEKYRWKRLEFYFQHDVSQFNAQGAAGLVIMSGLYDAASATPTSKAQVEVTEPHVICMPNQNSLLRFNVGRLHPQGVPLYVRPGALPGGTDIKTYDAANMFLTVQGMAGAGEVGELHVRGAVELIGDILDASNVAAPANNQFAFLQSNGPEDTGGSANSHLQALAGTQTGSLGLVNTNGSIQLPAGNFLLDSNATFVFTGNATQAALVLQKGGVGIESSAPQVVFSTGTLTTLSLSESVFVVSDGTAASAITVNAQATFSTGASTAYTTLRVLAV